MDTSVLDNPVLETTLAVPVFENHQATPDLRRVIEQIMGTWEASLGPLSHSVIRGVCDRGRDRYTIQQLIRPHGLQVAHTLVHLEIRDNKIYIEADATEEGIGRDLLDAGIPKSQIVLAFYPPDIREMGEFAVS